MSEYEASVESVHSVVRDFQHQMSSYPRNSILYSPSEDSSSIQTSFLEEEFHGSRRESSSSVEDSGKPKEKPFKCSCCVMSFTRPSDLQRHLLIHNNNKPYKCEECDREFTWFGNFQKHVLSHMVGSSRKPGTLPFSAMFTFLAREQVKELFIKDGDKYKCRLCAKDFTRLSGLKTHIRMHTGERPYVCEVCSFAFTTSRALKMHVRLHTGEKPYKCEECGRAFTRRDEMHTHMYIHKGKLTHALLCSRWAKYFNFLFSFVYSVIFLSFPFVLFKREEERPRNVTEDILNRLRVVPIFPHG